MFATLASSLMLSSIAAPLDIPQLGGRGPLQDAFLRANSDYQLGSEWGKRPVTAEDMNAIPGLASIARATAKVGGATGFFLGKFNGELVMATNHHVCPSRCSGSANFPVLNRSFPINRTLGTWKEIDLTLFTITVNSSTDEQNLISVGRNFSFANPLARGQELVTVGFGIGENPRQQMRGNWDSDCKIFSAPNEFRLMRDPDDLNPGPDAVWSFSNGCDVSHGDSGSAMVDRNNGEVLGIIWTGKIPKNPKVQDSTYLDKLIAQPTEEIWTELSFAVPALKMHEVLQAALAAQEIAADSVATVQVILGN